MVEHGHFKDAGLDRLSNEGYNVAQFVSYDEAGNQRFSRTKGNSQNHGFASQEEAVRFMLANTTEHSVNVRSFDPFDPKSKPFNYGITSVDDVLASLAARKQEGLHTIVNETVDIDDGGVSGVAFGNVIEFSPHDTPRCDEKPGTAQFSRAMGADIIRKVYGFFPTLAANPDTRLEFSIHPLRHGYKDEHTIVWEAERADGAPLTAETNWPNRFSNMLGDKTFGLMIADEIGLHVPQTTVFNRTVAPFTFGRETGSHETWLRTAPNALTPGKFTTTRGWMDPYELMHREDPEGTDVASVLRQDGVDAKFSGDVLMGADDQLILEGVGGFGDDFMVGQKAMVELPEYVASAVKDVYKHASDVLGPVRFEWVYDGTHVWVVQLHRGKSASSGQTIYPAPEGEEIAYLTYDASSGLEGLRELVEHHVPGTGIALTGNVGVTSHFGDVLRKARIPSRVERRL